MAVKFFTKVKENNEDDCIRVSTWICDDDVHRTLHIGGWYESGEETRVSYIINAKLRDKLKTMIMKDSAIDDIMYTTEKLMEAAKTVPMEDVYLKSSKTLFIKKGDEVIERNPYDVLITKYTNYCEYEKDIKNYYEVTVTLKKKRK